MIRRLVHGHLRRIKKRNVIDIQNVKREKFPEALGFMKRNYLDDPFMRAMGITERHRETHRFLSALWLTLLRSDMSLAAVHKGKICGLSINCPQTPTGIPPDDILRELAKLVKTDATRNLLLSWDKIYRETPLPSGVKPDGQPRRILELSTITVEPQYRKLLLGKRLLESTTNFAMLSGFQHCRFDCTSRAMAMICDRLGWRKIYEIPFDNFNGVMSDVGPKNDDNSVMVYLQDVDPTLKTL